VIEQHIADLLANIEIEAARLPRKHDRHVQRFQFLKKPRRLRRFARGVDAFEGDEFSSFHISCLLLRFPARSFFRPVLAYSLSRQSRKQS